MRVKCQKCGYEWNSSSQMDKVTCPNCGYKTPRTGETPETLSKKETSEHPQKGPKEVNTLTTKWAGAITLIVVVAIGAWAASAYLGGEEAAPGGGAETASITLTGSNVAFAKSVPGYTGGENVYVVESTETNFNQDFGGGSQPASVMATFTSESGETHSISAETSFYLVFAVKASSEDAATNEIAYTSLDNLYGYHEWTSGNLSGTENTKTTGNEYIFDNSADADVGTNSGWLEANIVFKNTGTGWSLSPDQSADFSINYYLYAE